jgi:hypothetical protein
LSRRLISGLCGQQCPRLPVIIKAAKFVAEHCRKNKHHRKSVDLLLERNGKFDSRGHKLRIRRGD